MRATVGSASAALATADPSAVDSAFLLKNMTGTAPIYLEVGSAATTTNGFRWDPTDGPMSLTLDKGEVLYAISGGADQTVHLLRAGR